MSSFQPFVDKQSIDAVENAVLEIERVIQEQPDKEWTKAELLSYIEDTGRPLGWSGFEYVLRSRHKITEITKFTLEPFHQALVEEAKKDQSKEPVN